MNRCKFLCTVLFVVVVCSKNVYADDNIGKSFGQVLKQGLGSAVLKTNNSKFIIASTFLADHAEDSIIGKAAVETAGYVFDATNGDLSKINYKEAGEHFIINYGIRRTTIALNNMGYTLDPLVNACDQLPAGVGAAVNPVIKPILQAVTHPQTLTLATVYTLNNFVIPYFE